MKSMPKTVARWKTKRGITLADPWMNKIFGSLPKSGVITGGFATQAHFLEHNPSKVDLLRKTRDIDVIIKGVGELCEEEYNFGKQKFRISYFKDTNQYTVGINSAEEIDGKNYICLEYLAALKSKRNRPKDRYDLWLLGSCNPTVDRFESFADNIDLNTKQKTNGLNFLLHKIKSQ